MLEYQTVKKNGDTARVTIHMVCSLDGYIANQENTIDWMYTNDHFEDGITLSEEEIGDYLNGIDCYIMGSRTYEHALKLGWPYGDVPVIVLSTRKLPVERKSVEIYQGNLKELVNGKLKRKYQNIWLVGGAMVAQEFIRQKLADDIIQSVLPVILGRGVPFFKNLETNQFLHLKNVIAFKDGMVELSYEIKK